MPDKAHKSRDEWKHLINDKISASDFQNLVYELLNASGFSSVVQRGGGADGGRDIEAVYTYVRPGGEKQTVKCWFQCKKQNKGVSYDQVSTDIARANNEKVDEYYIMSNFDTTPDCKDDIKKGQATWTCRVIDWSGLKFQDMLFDSPDICKRYFPDDEPLKIIDIKNPVEAINKSSELLGRFGLELKTTKKFNPNNPSEVAEALKEGLLNLKGLDPNLAAFVYQKMSMFFFSIQKPEDAILFLDKSIEINSKNVESLLNKGYILEKMDKIQESNDCYDKILSIDPRNKFALNNKSYNLWRLGDYEEALRLAEEALSIDPKFILAIVNKVNSLKGLRKFKEAMKTLQDEKDLVSNSIQLKSVKVAICIEILDLREAYKINEEILRENSNSAELLNNKGVILARNANFQYGDKYNHLALEYFEKAIQQDTKFAVGWSNKSAVFMTLNKIDEAGELLETAFAKFPDNPYVINKRALFMLNHSNKSVLSKVLKYFERASALRFDEEFLLNKAQAQIKLGKYQQAVGTLDRLIEYNPEKSAAWGIKGNALRSMHEITKSKICFANAEKFKEKPISLLED